MKPRVSVVVPTYRRADMLERCLGALTSQCYDPVAYEIIVADDAACEETRAQVECWAARAGDVGHTVRYVANTGSKGPAGARNTGWRAAQGRIIAFTDDDCIPDTSWLSAGMTVFDDGIVGAMGTIKVPIPPEPTDYELNAAGLEGAEFLTANCFYKRQALEEVGGFDETFPVAWREDTDLWFRFLKRGSRLVRVPEAVVVHPVRPASWGVSLQQQRKSMYNALLYRKHPELYRQRVQPGPVWRYYFILGALVTVLLSLGKRDGGMAFAAASAWLLLTGRFAEERLRNTSRQPSHVLEMAVTSALIPPLSIYWRIRGALKYRVPFL